MPTYKTVAPIRIHYTYTERTTCATVVAILQHPDGRKPLRIIQYGEAIKHPEDEYDRGVGECLSLARALEALARDLMTLAGVE